MWYVKYWRYILLFSVIAIIMWILEWYVFDSEILPYITQWILGIAILMIIYGIITIVNDKPIFSTSWTLQTDINFDANKVVHFLPFVNLYGRYRATSDKKTYRRKKESILLRWITMLLISIFPYPRILVVCVGWIAWRAIGLLLWFDLVSNTTKQWINNRFVSNPEEIISYMLWYIFPAKHTTLIEEEKIYWLPRTKNNMRALIPSLLLIAWFSYLIFLRWQSNIWLGISLLWYSYVILTFIIRFYNNTLCYQPVFDHIIRLFIRPNTPWKK